MKTPLTLTGLGAAAAGLALSVALVPTQAHAATVVPCNNISALRTAINQANATTGVSNITLIPGCTYTLTNPNNPADTDPAGLPEITGNVRISGMNSTITRAASASKFRIFTVLPGGTLGLTAVNVSSGATLGIGAGILNDGTLNVTDGAIRNNTASLGGGIANAGVATLTGTTISGNSAPNGNGGGILAVSGRTTLIGSRVTGNSATNGGGGIYKGGGTVSLVGALVAGNTPNNCRPVNSVFSCVN